MLHSAQELHVAGETEAIGEGAGDQRRRKGCHRELEDEEGEERDGRAVVRVGKLADVVEERVLEAADEAGVVVAEGQGEAEQHPDRGHDAEGDEALHHDGDHVLVTHEPAVEEAETRRHDGDQGGADEHERRVAHVDVTHSLQPPQPESPDAVRGQGRERGR